MAKLFSLNYVGWFFVTGIGFIASALGIYQFLVIPSNTTNIVDEAKEIAKLKIQNEGFNIDNKGFIKAVALGNNAIYYYSELSIKGDEESLRLALLEYPANTEEFKNIIQHVKNQTTDHYSKKLTNQISFYFEKIWQKKSLNLLYNDVCLSASVKNEFIKEFLHLNLFKLCSDETLWLENTVNFIGIIAQLSIIEEMSHNIRFEPKASQILAEKEFYEHLNQTYLTTKSKIVSSKTLIVFQKNLLYLYFYNGRTVSAVHWDSSSEIVKQCSSEGRLKLVCEADVTLFVSKDQTKMIISIRNIVAPRIQNVKTSLQELENIDSNWTVVMMAYEGNPYIRGFFVDKTSRAVISLYCEYLPLTGQGFRSLAIGSDSSIPDLLFEGFIAEVIPTNPTIDITIQFDRESSLVRWNTALKFGSSTYIIGLQRDDLLARLKTRKDITVFKSKEKIGTFPLKGISSVIDIVFRNGGCN